MIEEFLEVAIRLNTDMGVIPVLFGSLGMEIRTLIPLTPDDFDILSPKKILQQHWKSLVQVLNDLDYKLVALDEHEFEKRGLSIAFADGEGLNEFAEIKISEIEIKEIEGTLFKLLNEEQYFRVYTKCLFDSYRQSKKNNKDREKIMILEQLIKKK